MEQRKGLTLEGLNTRNFIFIITSLCMIGVSIYLTTHFYDVLYPTRLGGAASLCNISNFFNCDAATYSQLSNVAGVPISFFGIIVGMLFIFSALMPSEGMEKTANAVARYNFIGCVALFLFSLGALGSLCPFCTAYYALSGIVFYLFWKYGRNEWLPDMKVAGLWSVILLAGSFFMFQTTKEKEDNKNKLNVSIVEQFRRLPNLGEADVESPYKIHMSTKNFADSPIRMTIFSDFQCPFCKVVSEQLPDLIRRYGDKLSIQYMFYPLDNKCNPNVKHAMHEYACSAAMLAACDEKKFLEVHDDIFANQDQLPEGALKEIAARHNLSNCETDEMKNKVIGTINQGTKFNLKSTPTIIVNGKKIEGSIPSNQFFAIFDDILSGQK